MRDRLVPTIVAIGIPYYTVIFLYAKGLESLSTDPVFGLITCSIVFLLPALISKAILKKSYFGLGYILSTLIYPLIYILSYIFNRYLGIDAQLIYILSALIISILFISLLVYLTYSQSRGEVIKISKSIMVFLFIIVLLFVIYKILGIPNSSITSLDFLQHNSVSVQMSNGSLCITPNDCSSLFKKLGYTTYYHTIQTIITQGFGIEIGLAEVTSRLAFIATSGLTILSLIQKNIKDDELAFAGMLISLFTFELGAYSFNFLIPQTFTLLLFINILNEEKLTWKKFFAVLPIFMISHFVFGVFFSVLLGIYLLFFQKKSISKDLGKTVASLSFLAIIIVFLANWRGFSVEKLLQQKEIEQLGFFTNYYFPDNVIYLLKQYGFLIIFFVISVVNALGRKEIPSTLLYSVVYISVGLVCYFLAPTYASKFLLGSSVFMGILITYFVSKLKIKRPYGFVLLILIFLTSVPFYLVNFGKYNVFYTQSSGKISAITQEDKDLVNSLKDIDLDCRLVSDPLTQLIVQSQIPVDTAGGQYQELKTRKDFLTFIQNPDENTYEDLINNEEVGNNICFLITPRVYTYRRYVSEDQIYWLNSMYEYEIDNNYNYSISEKLVDFLKSKDYKLTDTPPQQYLFSR